MVGAVLESEDRKWEFVSCVFISSPWCVLSLLKSFPGSSSPLLQELIDAAMLSTSLGGMVAGGGAAAAGAYGGGIGGSSGLGGENGRVVTHDFPKAGPQGFPCMSKAASLGLSSTGMWLKWSLLIGRNSPVCLFVSKRMKEDKLGESCRSGFPESLLSQEVKNWGVGTFLPEKFQGLGRLSRDYVGFKTILPKLYFIYSKLEVCTENKTLNKKGFMDFVGTRCGWRHRTRNFMEMLADRRSLCHI